MNKHLNALWATTERSLQTYLCERVQIEESTTHVRPGTVHVIQSLEKRMSTKGSPRVSVTFRDVAVYFCEDEWEDLEEWRKELYTNVMREIHCVLISMGYAIVNPDTLFRIKKEEKPYVSNHFVCKKRESIPSRSSGSPVPCPDILLQIKKEEKPVLCNPLPLKIKESALNPETQHPNETSIISVRIKEEEDPYLLESQHSERTESFDSPTTSIPVVTSVFSIKNKPQDSSSTKQRPDLGKGFLEMSPEDGSIKRMRTSSEEFRKERKQRVPVSVIPREKPAQYSTKQMHCEIKQNPRASHRIQPTYKPGRNLEYERSFHHLTNPIVQQIIHAGEMPYTCFEFIDERWTHKERRIYYCNDCGRGFWKLYCFKVHQRTHTGEKPYTCNECEKSFSQSSNLIRHQKIHSGEKPYRCTECGKSFSQSSTLAKHQNTHIRVDFMQCRSLSPYAITQE